MILQDEREYQITKAQALKFEQAIAEIEQHPRTDLHPFVQKAHEEGLRGMLATLRQELAEYEARVLFDLSCPQCGRRAYDVCTNKTCVCHTSIPPGSKHLRWRWHITGMGKTTIPLSLGNWLWKAFGDWKHKWLVEVQECPYCGFNETPDYWMEREMEAYRRYKDKSA